MAEKIKTMCDFVHRGTALDYMNDGDAPIKGNDVMVLSGKRIGVAGCFIPVGKKGSCHITGVYAFDTAERFDVCDEAFWDADSGSVTKTDTGVKAGWVTEGGGPGRVRVKID